MGCSCSGITPPVVQLPVQQSSNVGGGSGAPNQSKPTQSKPTQSHAHSATQATQGASHLEHDKLITERTAPKDYNRAQRIMEAAQRLLSPLTFNGTGGEPNVDHRNIPESVKKEWARLYPDLPVPRKVVFSSKDANAKPIGALFMAYNAPVDLGLGPQHQHNSGPMHMQHMWIIPSNLDQAFSDVGDKATVIAAAKRAAGV